MDPQMGNAVERSSGWREPRGQGRHAPCRVEARTSPLLEGRLLAVVVPVVAFGVFELWRAVSTHLKVRGSVRLLAQAEEGEHAGP